MRGRRSIAYARAMGAWSRRWPALVAAGCQLGCRSPEVTPTPGRIALAITFGVLIMAIALAALAGGDGKGGKDGKDGVAGGKGGDAGGGWVVLAFLAAVAALIIGTCNTFTAPTERVREPTEAELARRRPGPPPTPRCADALAVADRAFAALDQAQADARAAALAVDRACRVEAAPATPPAASPATPPQGAAPTTPPQGGAPSPAPGP